MTLELAEEEGSCASTPATRERERTRALRAKDGVVYILVLVLDL